MATSRSTKAELFEEIEQLEKKIEELGGDYTGSRSDMESTREEFLEHHNFNQIFLDALPFVALLIKSSTREIVKSNEAGLKAGAVPGKYCYETLGQREDPCPWCLAPDVWADGGAQHLVVEATNIIWDTHWYPISEDLYLYYAFDITDLKQAENSLRQSEEKFRVLFESSPASTVYTDLEGNIVMCNPKFLDLHATKGDAQEQIGRNVADFFPPEEHERLSSNIKQTIESGIVHGPDEYSMLREDGTFFRAETTSTLLKDIDGAPIGLIAQAQDITEREKVEEAISLQSEIALNIVDGIYLVRLSDLKILYTNEYFEQMFGYYPGEMIGKPVTIVNFPTDKTPEEIADEIVTIVDEKGCWSGEIQNIKKDGTPFWCQASVSLFEHPRYGKVMVTVHKDITERKMIEQALVFSEGKYRELVEKAGIAIMIYRPEDEITFFNDTFADLFRYPADEMSSVSLSSLVHPDDWERLSTFLSDRIKGLELTTRFEFQGVCKDGAKYTLECDSADMEQDGVVVGQRLYMWDITNKKMIEKELLRSHEQLRMLSDHIQAAREEERALIAQTIHDELGQNLTAMNMDISWIEKKLLPEQEILKNKAAGIAGLIYETLQRVKRLSAELRPGLLDDLGIVAAIEWQADEFRNATGIKCEMDLDKQIPKLDEESAIIIFRIFQEAMTNVARHAKATQVKVVFKRIENHLVLEVSDNGQGIKAEEIDKQTSFGIVGIKERVRQLGSTVSFKTKRGKGTTVRVLIPMVEEGYRE